MRVLGKLFRRLFLTRLIALHDAGRLAFFGDLAPLADRRAFLRHLAPVRKKRWVVYAKPPFAGPEAVLAYLSRYTHRVAISNRRLLAFDETGVTFRYKDYRRDGAERQQVMTLGADEFIRRFLLHVLPHGFHRIRHYGLLASSARKASLALARKLLAVAPPPEDDAPDEPLDVRPPCPCCGGRMIIIETFERWRQPRAPPPARAPSGRRRHDPAWPAHVPGRSTLVAANDRIRAIPRQRRLKAPSCQRLPRHRHQIQRHLDRSRHVPRFPLSVVTSSRSAKNKIPIDHLCTTRGFVPRGLSYAKRRPKLFTKAERRVNSLRSQQADIVIKKIVGCDMMTDLRDARSEVGFRREK